VPGASRRFERIRGRRLGVPGDHIAARLLADQPMRHAELAHGLVSAMTNRAPGRVSEAQRGFRTAPGASHDAPPSVGFVQQPRNEPVVVGNVLLQKGAVPLQLDGNLVRREPRAPARLEVLRRRAELLDLKKINGLRMLIGSHQSCRATRAGVVGRRRVWKIRLSPGRP
jgi:hypothetical protein